jgi:hypothetical protein
VSRWWRLGAAAVLLLLVAGSVVLAHEAWDRARVDTAVAAVAVGEPGCVTAARFTGPDGVERTVEVRRYKGACRSGDPGDRVTVYYDADDPAVTAAGRAWWWPALLAVVLAGPALLLARGVVRPTAPVRARSSGRRSAAPAPAAAPSPPASRPLLDPAREDAHLAHDRATGRVEVLRDAVAAERSLAPERRATGATDATLDAARRHLDELHQDLRSGTTGPARKHASALTRLVLDAMDPGSSLANDLVDLRRQLFG